MNPFDQERFEFVHTSLVEDGVDLNLAHAAATIVAAAHPSIPPTPQQQQILTAAWKNFRGYYLPPDRLKPYLFPTMTQPIGYYVDAHPAIAAFENTFGSTLQCLDKSEKLHLIGILAIREQQVADGDDAEDIPVSTAYIDHPFAGTEAIDACCKILDLLPSRQTRQLILTLASQINQP